MNTTSASPVEESSPHGVSGSVRHPGLVWDVPVRVFHWLMVIAFAGAWITSDSETWRLAHITLGYTMAALVVFRLVWGFVGTRWARFSSFVRGPRAVVAYVKGMIQGRAQHHTGHNPAGAVAILLLLGLTLVVAVSGWAVLNEIGGDSIEELHEAAAIAMLVVVGMHVAGVALGSWVHRENLVRAMITGRKDVPQGGEAVKPRAAIGMVVAAAVLVFWWLQWHVAPASGTAGPTTSEGREHRDADD
jgi:cytochrome b